MVYKTSTPINLTRIKTLVEGGETLYLVVFPLESIDFWKNQGFDFILTYDALSIPVSTEEKARFLLNAYRTSEILDYPAIQQEIVL